MRIAIASGKGGTGKTTVAVNLAWMLSGMGKPVQYLDCDVEEPNGHIFLKPQIMATASVGISVPVVDEQKYRMSQVRGNLPVPRHRRFEKSPGIPGTLPRLWRVCDRVSRRSHP